MDEVAAIAARVRAETAEMSQGFGLIRGDSDEVRRLGGENLGTIRALRESLERFAGGKGAVLGAAPGAASGAAPGAAHGAAPGAATARGAPPSPGPAPSGKPGEGPAAQAPARPPKGPMSRGITVKRGAS